MNRFTDTLHIDVGISPTHRGLTIALHLLGWGVAALLFVFGHRQVGLLALAGVCCSFGIAWRTASLARMSSIVRLRWRRDRRWRWQTRNGVWHSGRLVDAYRGSDILVVLRLRPEGARWRERRCVLFRDAIAATDHRRLRARLTVTPPDPSSAPDG